MGDELDKMRKHYEDLADKNRAEMDRWASQKLQEATEQSSKDRGRINDYKDKISEYRKRTQILEAELQSVTEKNRQYRNQLNDEGDSHRREIKEFQRQVKEGQHKFELIKSQMADHERVSRVDEC